MVTECGPYPCGHSSWLDGHLCLSSSIWPRLVVESRHQKDMCRNAIGVCVHNIDSRCRLVDVKFRKWKQWRRLMWSLKKKENYIYRYMSSLWPPLTFIFQLRLWNLKWQFAWITIADRETIPIRSNRHKIPVELEGSILAPSGPHGLDLGPMGNLQ